jgi:polysaccharide deacetylase family protein (PEP-CTERM system associated)
MSTVTTGAGTDAVTAFTVDWEDWYQGLTSTSRRYDQWDGYESRLERNTGKMLDLLSEYSVRATFFVLGHAARQYPHLLRKVQAAGHEIAVHSYRHRLVYELTPEEFRRDTQEAIDTIQHIIGERVYGYRAPAFSVVERSAWALPILEELGIEYDSSVFPGKNVLYGWPGTPRFPYRVGTARQVLEVPVSTVKVGGRLVPMAGGFYLRLLPIAFVKWAIDRIHAEGQPAILYTHPWEIDPEHPRPQGITSREQISHYLNLGQTEGKLRSLLRSLSFKTMRELVCRVD